MHKILATAILGAMLAAAQTQPTAPELLQKGIYAQETAGDLEGAAKIYRQIVDSHPVQKEIAAEAQYRLGMTLLQKGDAALASQEIQRLAWDFPDYKDLIASSKTANGTIRVPITFTVTGPGTPEQRHDSSLEMAKAKWQAAVVTQDVATRNVMFAVAGTVSPEAAGGKSFIATGGNVYVTQQPNHDMEFDFSRPMTLTGTVLQVQWLNPYAWLTVDVASANEASSRPYLISLDSPAALMASGWSRDTVKPRDQVTVTGAQARDGSVTLQATSVSANGAVLFTHNAATR